MNTPATPVPTPLFAFSGPNVDSGARKPRLARGMRQGGMRQAAA